MKTIELKLYSYEELSDEAKKRALDDWNEHNDDPYMQSHMINLLKEELEERGLEYDTDSIDVRYSLSHCQGDGFMFLGKFIFASELEKVSRQWKKYNVSIKHDGHYYHSNSKIIEIWDESGEFSMDADEKVYEEFEKIYQAICKKMETIGYEYIEYEQSEENFINTCEANDYTFEANGEMRNEA